MLSQVNLQFVLSFIITSKVQKITIFFNKSKIELEVSPDWFRRSEALGVRRPTEVGFKPGCISLHLGGI